tara:strand:+ start:2294 stop:2914 length:621 start_codon:yes stop_codon:yes gene_type:complete
MNIIEVINGLRVFDIEIIDIEAFTELVVRYVFNLSVIFIIVKFGYSRLGNNKDYFFTFFAINTLIFFVCFLFSNVKLSIGFAFGLFAIFSILRYRTITIPIKEMTFLFSAITIAIINALSTSKVSFAELFFTNIIIIIFILILSKLWLHSKESSVTIYYETIENIKPANRTELFADLEVLIGVKITQVKILKVNTKSQLVTLKVYY